MNYDPNLQVLYISRVRFFDIVSKFPDVGEKIVQAGEFSIRGRLTEEDKKKIIAAFPGSIWE